jgi:hypothetical protein
MDFMDKILANLDGIKTYLNAGQMGAGHKWRPQTETLASVGGVPQDLATDLSRERYRQQVTMKEDPNWQGPPDIQRPREAPFTNAEKDELNKQFFSGKAAREQALELSRMKQTKVDQDHYFDQVTNPRTVDLRNVSTGGEQKLPTLNGDEDQQKVLGRALLQFLAK